MRLLDTIICKATERYIVIARASNILGTRGFVIDAVTVKDIQLDGGDNKTVEIEIWGKEYTGEDL